MIQTQTLPDDLRQLRQIEALDRAFDSLPAIFVKHMSEMLHEASRQAE